VISAVVDSTAAEAERRVSAYVDELDGRYRRRADAVEVRRRRYRLEIANSDWLLYARSLFNRSVALSSLTTSTSSSSSSSSTEGDDDDDDEVMRFLEKMMSVHTVRRRRWFKSARLQRSVTRDFHLHVT